MATSTSTGELKQKPKDDDLVFETFYHRSGKESQCVYQGGLRFYLDDKDSKEWKPFPRRWYNEGLLVTNTILKEDGAPNSANKKTETSGQTKSRGSGQSSSIGGGASEGLDDRKGFIMHPKKGRIPTYIFYKKHNVHMYFDADTGAWVRMPIGFELHHDMVKDLVDKVEEAIPSWNDRADILSLLRACNYDADECINIYQHLEKDEWMKVARTPNDVKALEEKDKRIAYLEEKVRNLELSQGQKGLTTTDKSTDESNDLSTGSDTVNDNDYERNEVGGRRKGKSVTLRK